MFMLIRICQNQMQMTQMASMSTSSSSLSSLAEAAGRGTAAAFGLVADADLPASSYTT